MWLCSFGSLKKEKLACFWESVAQCHVFFPGKISVQTNTNSNWRNPYSGGQQKYCEASVQVLINCERNRQTKHGFHYNRP
mmetsp:Transcript_23882/g.27515  ORF Transcript_23882/g.27515 Transcript_23882/m.27515 type:complete len:80 (+) Transcript_23882:716-955(+)